MSFIANILSETPSARNLHHIETNQQICNANLLTGFYMTRVPTKVASAHALVKEFYRCFFCVFRMGRYCLTIEASDIFLFTLLLLKPFPTILNSFNDTEGWPDCKVCCTMCDLSLHTCSNTLSLIHLAVFPR